MRTKDIADIAVQLVTRYYDNDIQPFLSLLHEDIVWVGPAAGQIIIGRDALIKAFMGEQNDLHFATHNVVAMPLATGSSAVYEVFIMLLVDTFWPDGHTNRVDQRISVTVCMGKGEPRILHCHISDAIAYDNRDVIYPLHYLQTRDEELLPAGSKRSGRLCLRGQRGTLLYLDQDRIVYIETQGRHTLFHTVDGDYESVESITTVARNYGDLFLRCHPSYLVNPAFVRESTRFQLVLTGGAIVPVPEKKYAAVKSRLNSLGVAGPAQVM